MKKNISILLIIFCIFSISSTFVFASETIDVKDYIKGKFPMIFNIYLSSLGELDEYEKEFIDLLQNLPEEEQKNFAKEIYDNGFSKVILENCRENIIAKEEEPGPGIEEKIIEGTTSTGKWICNRETNPIDDKLIITFTLECEKDESNEPIFLIIKKEGKDTIIFIDWSRELRPFYETMITVWTRFGDDKVSHSAWETVSSSFKFEIYQSIFGKQKTSSQYTFYPRREINFINKLMNADRFVAEFRSFNKMNLTAVFDVRGLKNAVEQFDDILNWIKD